MNRLEESLPVIDEQMTPHVRARGWRMPSWSPDWPVGAHRAIEIAWVEQGWVRYRIGSRTLEATAGSAVIVPVQVEHKTTVSPGAIATSIWIGPELAALVADAIGGRAPRRAVVLDDSAPITALGRMLLDEARGSMAGRFLTADSLAEALLVKLCRQGDEKAVRPGGSDSRVAAALDRIESDYARPLTIDELARAATMSRYHFSRLFRAQVGSSPYQYLVETRVRRAAELLFGGRTSVTEAAFAVGFGDLGRFGQAFRRVLGTSPSEYRASTKRDLVRSPRSLVLRCPA
jgi:AraC-like DNA-binding protein